MKFCSSCEKEVDTVWKFSQERCYFCGKPLSPQIKIMDGIYGMFDRIENNRKAIEGMIRDGEISKSDLR